MFMFLDELITLIHLFLVEETFFWLTQPLVWECCWISHCHYSSTSECTYHL